MLRKTEELLMPSFRKVTHCPEVLHSSDVPTPQALQGKGPSGVECEYLGARYTCTALWDMLWDQLG